MEMKHVAPLWARTLILPALGVFGLGGLGIVVLGIAISVEQINIGGVLAVAAGLFFVIGTWEARGLYEFRNTVACLEDDVLHHASGPMDAPRTTRVEDVIVENVRWLQVVNLHSASAGERLMTIDYKYGDGMALVGDILAKKRQSSSLSDLNP